MLQYEEITTGAVTAIFCCIMLKWKKICPINFPTAMAACGKQISFHVPMSVVCTLLVCTLNQWAQICISPQKVWECIIFVHFTDRAWTTFATTKYKISIKFRFLHNTDQKQHISVKTQTDAACSLSYSHSQTCITRAEVTKVGVTPEIVEDTKLNDAGMQEMNTWAEIASMCTAL